VDSSGVETIKEQLEKAYARLKTLPAGDDTAAVVQEIDRLERELLRRYTTYVEQRDSTVPPLKAD